MRDWKKIFVGYLSLLVLGFMDNVRGPFYPDIISDLQLSDTMGSMFFILVSLMAIFSGQFTPEYVRRLGLANAMRAGHGFLFFGCLGIAYSPTFLWLSLSCIVFGFGFGFINVGQNFLIIEGALPHRRRQFLSGLHSIYALASLLAPALVSAFKYFAIDWRKGFMAVAILPVIGFANTFLVQGSKEEARAANKQKVGFIESVLEWKHYFLYATQISFYISAELGLTTRMVLYLQREHQVSEVLAPQYLSAFFACLLLGRLLFAFFSFSRWNSHQIISVALASSTIFFVLGLSVSPYWLVACGFTMAPVFGFSMDYLAETFPKKSEAAIASTLAISSLYIISMHFIIGLITEHFDIGLAMYFCPLMLLISFVMLQFMPKHKTKVA